MEGAILDGDDSFDVFFSYHRADQAAVEAVARALTHQGLKVFFDRWYLTPGRPWPRALEELLGSCKAVAVFLGGEGLGSWQQRERDFALDRQTREPAFPVIPVLLDDADPGLGFLGANTWVDLSHDVSDPASLRVLAAAIRRKPPGPPAPEQIGTPRAAVCPYRGLRPFREEDEPYFFGRAAFTKALQAAVLRRPLVAVVGASGSGKSSVVRAGLIPQLRRGAGGHTWDAITLAPAERPLTSLAAALIPALTPDLSEVDRLAEGRKLAGLLGDGAVTLQDVAERLLSRQPGTDRLLLFIDQWEELYTLCSDEEERRAFIDQLLEAIKSGSVQVVLTLRGDFIGQALDNRALADRLQDGIVTMGPMTREELSETILRPAEKTGLCFEEGLPETILDDLGDEPGSLPLLEFLLEGLWTSRQGTLLTHEAYARLGRVSGAIARRAETVFEHGLDEAERAAARRLLMRMVRPGEGVADTRRRTALPEGDATAERAMHKLAQERLVVTGRDASSGAVTVAVAHEALIRRWDRLREWVDADREFLRTRERLAAGARLWEDEHRSPERLLPPGRPLAEGEDLLANRRADLEPLLIDFVQASSTAARAAEEARQAEQRRRLRRARLLSFSMVALAVVAMGGGLVAWWQRDVAARNAEVAAEQARLARGAELATRARALFTGAPGRNTTAALLAVESLRLGGGAEAQGLIDDILALTPRGVHALGYVPPYSRVIQSPDGKMNLVWKHEGHADAPGAGMALVLDAETGAVRARVEQAGWVAPALAPGGRWLAVGGWGRRLQVVDLWTGERVIDEYRPGLTTAAFSPDGNRLYVADGGGTVETRAAPDWAVESKARFREGEWHNRRLNLVPSPGGKKLLISFGGGAWLGPPSGPFRPLPDLEPWVRGAAFDAAGTRMVVFSGWSRVEIRDASSGAIQMRFERFGIESWTFSPDGTRLAVGDENGIIDIWDTTRGERLLQLDQDRKNVNALTYTPDGSRLVAAYASGAVRVFKASDGTLLNTWVRPSAVTAATFRKDGAALYLGDEQGAIHRFDPNSGSATELFRLSSAPKKGVKPVGIDPQTGLLFAGVRSSGEASSWTDVQGIGAETGKEIWHQVLNGNIHGVTFSPDGAVFATATPRKGDDDLILWDALTGEPLHQERISVHRDGLHFTGDGSRLVVTSYETKVIDPGTGDVLFDIGEPGGVDGMAVLPDRKTVVTYGNDGIVRAWDAVSKEERWRRSESDLDRGARLSGNAARYARLTAGGRALIVSNTRTGVEVARIPLSARAVHYSLSPAGDRMLVTLSPESPDTGGRHSLVELWDVDERKLLQRLRGSRLGAKAEFGADGYARVIMPGDRLVILDTTTGEVLWEAPFQRGWISNPSPLSRASGVPLVVQASDYTSLRSARTGKELTKLDFGVSEFAIDRARYRMAVRLLRRPGEGGPQIAMIDLGSGTRLWTAEGSAPGQGSIEEMHFSSDGLRLLVLLLGSKDSGAFLKVYDVLDGRLLATLNSESGVKRLELLSDPDLVVTLDFAKTVRVWQLSTGKELRRVAHGFSTDGVSVAADGPRAVTWKKGSLRVWDLRDGLEIAHRVTDGAVEEAALDPKGGFVAYRVERARHSDAGDRFQAIALWKVDGKSGGSTLRRLPLEGTPRGLVFDPSGKRLAARVGDHEIRVWDVATLRQLAPLRSTQGGRFSDDHSFGRQGDYYFAWETDAKAGGQASQLRVWHLPEKGGPVEIARLDGPLRIAEGVEGKLLTAGKQEGKSRDLGSASQEMLPYPSARYCCSGVAGPSRLVINKDYNAISALETATGKIIEMRRDPSSDSLSAAAFSHDLSKVFMAERDRDDGERVPGAVRLKTVPEGREIAQIRPGATIAKILPVDSDRAALLLGSPGGGMIGGNYRNALLWRPATGGLLNLNGKNPVGTAEVSPDGRLIVLGEGVEEQEDDRLVVRGKSRVTVWDARTGERIHTLAFEKPPTDIAFSSDGALMVVRGTFTFVAYEVGSWQELRRTKAEFGHGSGRTAVLDGDWIVVPDQKSLRLVSIQTGEEVKLRHNKDHPAFIVSGDDGVFATIDRASLRVWQIRPPVGNRHGFFLRDGTPLRTSTAPGVDLVAKFESPAQGRRPFFAGVDNRLFLGGKNSLRRLLYRPEVLEAEVCRRMGRGLSEEEVAAFFPRGKPANPCRVKR